MSTFPYDITLYLDCDTIIRGPIRELFQLVKNHDMLIANSPLLNKKTRPFKLVKYARPRAYNSGVIVFRKTPPIIQLFQSWLKLAQQDRRALAKVPGKFFDQPKLVHLLNQPDCPVNLKVIPNTIYNCRHTMVARVKKDRIFGRVKILHAH